MEEHMAVVGMLEQAWADAVAAASPATAAALRGVTVAAAAKNLVSEESDEDEVSPHGDAQAQHPGGGVAGAFRKRTMRSLL